MARRLSVAACLAVLVALAVSGEAQAGPIVNFGPPTSFTTGTNPEAIATGDFNGDSDPDVAIANEVSGTISVLVGGAGGTFTGPTNYTAGTGPTGLAVGDFNGDGDLDLATTVSTAAAGDSVAILLGATGATFGSPTTFPLGADFPTDIAVGQFNGDSDPDLAVTNQNTDNVAILIGAGSTTATFATATHFSAGDRPSAVAVSDFTGDGDPDLAVTNFGQSGATAPDNVSILTGDPQSGRFFGPTNITVGDFPTDVAAGDFNGDLDPDLAITNLNSSSVSILTGTTGAGFNTATAISGSARAVEVADVNKDSDLDLVVGTGNAGMSVYVGGAGATFGTAQPFASGGVPLALAVADFNADTLPDVAAANYFDGRASTMLNTSDLTAPNTTISPTPPAATNDTTPTFSFSSSEPTGATFQCRLYSGATPPAFTSCTNPFTPAAPLAPGSYTFEVRAVDVGGNVDGTPATHAFTVDTTVPNTTISPTPPAATNDTTPTFNFTSSEPTGATFECRVYSGATPPAFAACTNPFTPAAPLAPGSYTFEVRARDPAGNVDGTPATHAFTVDTTPPTVTIDTGPAGATGDNTPTFTFSSNEAGAVFACRVGSGTPTLCTSPHTTAPLSDGPHTFEVFVADPAGNSGGPASRALTVDASPPDTSFTSGPSGLTNDKTPTFAFSSSEAGATFQCKLDNAPAFSACTSPHTTAALTDGTHTLQVQALDAQGNADPSAATRTVTVDSTPPETKIDSGPSGAVEDDTPTFVFSSTEPGARFQCKLDNSPFIACTSPLTLPKLSPGSHTFQVRSIDRAGNVDQSPSSSLGAEAALRAFIVQSAAVDPPVYGRRFNVEPIKGDVFVSVPPGTARASAKARASITVPGIKGRDFIPLREARQVPVGSLLDTRKGTVRLQSARNKNGATQASEFVGGVFQVLQSGKTSAKGLTELRLKGASFRSCGRTGKRTKGKKSDLNANAARRSKRRIRRLRGNGKGRFRTRGRYSSATVRGTIWTVTDRCDGTLTKVSRGRVAVRDLRKRKTKTLRAGKSYLARAP
jgi:hypothetical protein